MARGLMVYPMGGTIDGQAGDHVLLAPPFITTPAEIDEIVRPARRRGRRRADGHRAAGGARVSERQPDSTIRRTNGVDVSCGAARVRNREPPPVPRIAPRLFALRAPDAAPSLHLRRSIDHAWNDNDNPARSAPPSPPRRESRSPARSPRRCPPARSRNSSPSAPAASPACTTRWAARSAASSTRTAPRHGIRCSVESTGGSVYNVNTIKAGELDFGMTQSDVQYQDYNGTGPFKEADKDLRAVFSVHPEPFTVARAQGSQHQAVHRLQGQALQRRQPGVGHALGDGRAARRREHEAIGLRARLRAEGRRARPGAVRQQDRRLLLRRRPSVGQHPGSDDGLRRQARFAHRSRDRRAREEVSVLRERDDPRRDVRQQPGADEDLWRAGDARELVEGSGRHGLRHHQGGVREHRRVQEAPSGVRQPRPQEHDQGRPLGAAA